MTLQQCAAHIRDNGRGKRNEIRRRSWPDWKYFFIAFNGASASKECFSYMDTRIKLSDLEATDWEVVSK